VSRSRDKLRALCAEAERDLAWKDLAVFIDALHEEYEHFSTLISQRRIGRGIPKSQRPAVRAEARR
jgi:hypothetical protein